jgi:hypothetical protein
MQGLPNMKQGVRLIDNTTAKSPYWKHFSYAVVNGTVDKAIGICKICQARVKHSRNTTNLKHHLETWHLEILTGEPNAKTADSPKLVATSHTVQPSNNRGFIASTKTERINNMLTMYLIKGLHPISTIDNLYFRALMFECESRYIPPSQDYFLRVKIPELYSDSKAALTTDIVKTEKVCITVEQWQAKSSQLYVTLTAHYINDKWELKSKVLQTDLISEDSSAENIASIVKQAFVEWTVPEEYGISAVTDNTGHVTEVMTILNCQPIVSCLAYTINEAAHAGMQLALDILEKTRNLVRFFNRSALSSSILQEIQMQLNLPVRELVLDIPSLWYTSYDMLDMTIKQHSAICATLQDPRV